MPDPLRKHNRRTALVWGAIAAIFLLVLCLSTCGCSSQPASVLHQHVEGIADVQAFAANVNALVNRFAAKLLEVADDRAEVQTELALEQETVAVDVVVVPATETEPAQIETRRYLSPEIVETALEEFRRLRRENVQAVAEFLGDGTEEAPGWHALKGDLRLALARARLIREALERRGVEPEDVRAFGDAFAEGLEGANR